MLTAMNDSSETIRAEIRDIRMIVQAACAAERAQRGAPVDPHEVAVQVRVADMILNGIGARLRAIHGSAADAA
jgi:hypothetical protein